MLFDKIKDCFRSEDKKIQQILKLSRGEITIESIKYLNLYGSNDGFKPDEILIFIGEFLKENRGWDKIKVINKGCWTSGRIDSYDLTIKNGFCTIEQTIKQY